MRSLSVGAAAPSAVVWKVNLVGISLPPGLPSTVASILAPSDAISVPSPPPNLIAPKSSAS